MIKKIKTIWQGKAGLHQKYIQECREKNESLELIYTGNQEQYLNQKMTIVNFDEGETGKEKYPEKHGNGFYSLIYFKWVADIDVQKKLL